MYILLRQAFVKSQAVSEQRNNNSDPLIQTFLITMVLRSAAKKKKPSPLELS